MKAIYIFMIGLILFNFYACAKQQTLDPNSGIIASQVENAKLEISYLDDNNQTTETRTDNILMKLKDDDSGFLMISKKTSEEEYTDYLIDTKNESTISMHYKNGEAFPYKILIVQGEESMEGYTSSYREESKDFDIIWSMKDGSSETFKNIPITAIFNHSKTDGVDNDTDYQIKTIKVSVRIADAINKFIDENYSENPMMRGWNPWNAFCNLWKSVIKPILKVVTVIVAIFVPPVAKIMVTVVNIIDTIVSNTVNKLISNAEDKEKASSGNRELFILKTYNNYNKNNMYTNNQSIYLMNRYDITNIIFEVTEASIGKFSIWLSVPDESSEIENSIITGSYGFSYKENQTKNSSRCFLPLHTVENKSSSEKQPYLSSSDFNNSKYIDLIIKRLANSVGHDIHIDVKLEDNVFVNKIATNSFKLILQKD